jgi:TonB family protein
MAGGAALYQTENNPRFTAGIPTMNTKSKLTLSLGILAAPLVIMAWSPEKAYVESYRTTRTDAPVPTSVTMPDVSARHVGKQVVLEFVVDPTGTPTSITSSTPGADAELVASVSEAVAKWKFNPAYVDGKPVARRVALPVNIVANPDLSSRFASN